MTSLRILIVEDDPGMALLVDECLTVTSGWAVTRAASAQECRARMAERAPDLILLDRGLPDCDGASLITELLAQHPDLAIVMLTGADSAISATETLKLGAWDYVVKRPDLSYLDELPGIVRRCAERLAWRREEARLRGEMNILLTAIRSAADFVIMIDAEGRVRFWNVAAEKVFGWAASEVEGSELPFIPPERQEEFAEMGERARRGQPLVGVETALNRRDGGVAEVSVTLTALCNADGTVRAYVTVGHDISERKRLERDRADLAAMLTHDVKNPVTAILGYAAELRYLGPECIESAAAIQRSAEMINTLISNFLISATIERGALELRREPVSVTSLVAGCVRQFRAAASTMKVRFSQEGEVPDACVLGDRLQLDRALSNLIGNALKFTPPGGAVSVCASCESHDIVIRVRDTGPGISQEALPRIFEKYRRDQGTHRIDGAGLGLFIAQSLVQAHGGAVSAVSELGAGSTFEMRLPLHAGSVD